jgi:excinuclease UvrABC ATPase subunit
MTDTSAASDLTARYLAGDPRALARALTLAEAGLSAARLLLRAARARGVRSVVLGVTGSPGSGKSTLTDALIAALRARIPAERFWATASACCAGTPTRTCSCARWPAEARWAGSRHEP